jgi:5,10-methylenetetrahydromethanopterin reductase
MLHFISIALQTNKSITAYGPLAATAEKYGFAAVTVYNDLLFQPAWLPLLEIARHTRRVRLGPAAVNPFTCHPINIAGNIALIDEAAQGRAYLGLARGSWLDFLGIRPDRPATALHEAFECIRRLLAGSKEKYQGEIFSLAGGESFRWNIYRSDIPFLLGSWGAKTIRACLQDINEIKVGGSANPDLVPQMRRVIADAAARIKRDPADISLVFGAVTVVDLDGQAAKKLARREAALYLPIIAELDPSLDIEPARLEGIRAAAARHDYEQVATYISDELLRRLAFAGTPDEITAQTATLFEAGVQRVEFGTPHGLTTGAGLRLLGERVLPALRGRYIE